MRVERQTAGRKGKGVTVVRGLSLNLEQLEQLATTLKRRCASGGTVRDGVIEIQGEHRDKVCGILKEMGYDAKRAGG